VIEPTDEMEQALLREVDRVGVQNGGIRAGLAAVLAIVERDYGWPNPMLLVDGRCGGCGHDVSEHKRLGCYAMARPVTCACERTDSMLKAGRTP
jgi:hypothetical protein